MYNFPSTHFQLMETVYSCEFAKRNVKPLVKIKIYDLFNNYGLIMLIYDMIKTQTLIIYVYSEELYPGI